ncbi:helix-turn-helix domain-containing protein [Streptomyces sp. YC537]|uniref:Helix-turn-helix domain-containing protein n=1 Tax=Streptomyces boluensis TaxID=1775135 RepID=A0A964XKL6_9ACTN|nr:helix-turn-helix domain-containing protein [Streptomyces boluensis]
MDDLGHRARRQSVDDRLCRCVSCRAAGEARPYASRPATRHGPFGCSSCRASCHGVTPSLQRNSAREAGGTRIRGAAPARAWTVAALAAEAGASRSAFARRFTALVGEPPLTYLTHWRMALATELLCAAPVLTVAAVARRVGYRDSFAFSVAFKRVRGISPSTVSTRPAQADPTPS